jgi:two-component system response regulator YesN
MRDYVLKHYDHPLQLSDVAAALGKNAAYLSTLFSQTTGVTFHHYLEEVRLAKAKELLSDPANCVGDVACAVGYGSASHFRHVFKDRTGVAPHLWDATR